MPRTAPLQTISFLLLACCALVAPGQATAQPAGCGPVPLRAPTPDVERTEILVLATPHLRRIEGLDRSTLDGLLDVLERWEPDRIGVEALPPEDIAAMRSRPAFEPVLRRFAGMAIDAADLMAVETDTGWAAAAGTADSLLALLGTAAGTDRTSIRARAIPALAAAYRPLTSALQWSYLKETGITARTIRDTLRFILEERLEAGSEEAVIGLALARRLGHERVYPIDDHFDKDAYLAIAGELQAQLAETEAYRDLVASGALEAATTRLREAHASGDLLPYYLEINAPEAQAADVDLQWDFFFETRLSSGLDRTRVAMWEERNYGIAANVRRMTARIPGGRALVVIGASHKPFLDAYLACGMDVAVVQLEDVVEPASAVMPDAGSPGGGLAAFAQPRRAEPRLPGRRIVEDLEPRP